MQPLIEVAHIKQEAVWWQLCGQGMCCQIW